LGDPIHRPNIFGETSTRGIKPGGAADFFVGGTLGERLVLAVVTLAAGDVMKNYDAVSGLELAHLRADGGDYSGGFMSENAGSGMGAGRDFLQVGAANSAAVHPQQQFAGADLGYGNSLQANIVHTAVDRRLHGGRNRPHSVLHCVLSGDGHNVHFDDNQDEFASTLCCRSFHQNRVHHEGHKGARRKTLRLSFQ
jgi:hypothetical protein